MLSLDDLINDVSADVRSGTARVRATKIQESNLHDLNRSLTLGIYREIHTGNIEATRDVYEFAHPPSISRLLDITETRPVQRRLKICEDIGPDEPSINSHTIVSWQGLRLAIPEEQVIRRVAESADILFSDVRPSVSPSFFLVDRGIEERERKIDHVLRVYLNFSHFEFAVDCWPSLLSELDNTGCPYQAKILALPSQYPRRDSIVVYSVWPGNAAIVVSIIDLIKDMPGLGAETSEFSMNVAPGMGVAWDPADPRIEMAGLSFGQHRSAVLSRALISASASDVDPLIALKDEMKEAHISYNEIYRNTESPHLPNTHTRSQTPRMGLGRSSGRPTQPGS